MNENFTKKITKYTEGHNQRSEEMKRFSLMGRLNIVRTASLSKLITKRNGSPSRIPTALSVKMDKSIPVFTRGRKSARAVLKEISLKRGDVRTRSQELL